MIPLGIDAQSKRMGAASWRIRWAIAAQRGPRQTVPLALWAQGSLALACRLMTVTALIEF